ncbi:hypothetical protein [Streptomyces sp. NPDC054765]
MSADFQYRHEQRVAGKPRSTGRRSSAAGTMLGLLVILASKLRGDAPLVLNYAAEAEQLDTDEVTLQARIEWLVEHHYLALDGQVNGVARLWMNPAVAFLPRTTDPRVAAARHRFPYIVTDPKGMAAEQPIHVAEYDEQGWEQVYRLNAEQFEDPPRFSFGCPHHHDTGPYQ